MKIENPQFVFINLTDDHRLPSLDKGGSLLLGDCLRLSNIDSEGLFLGEVLDDSQDIQIHGRRCQDLFQFRAGDVFKLQGKEYVFLKPNEPWIHTATLSAEVMLGMIGKSQRTTAAVPPNTARPSLPQNAHTPNSAVALSVTKILAQGPTPGEGLPPLPFLKPAEPAKTSKGIPKARAALYAVLGVLVLAGTGFAWVHQSKKAAAQLDAASAAPAEAPPAVAATPVEAKPVEDAAPTAQMAHQDPTPAATIPPAAPTNADVQKASEVPAASAADAAQSPTASAETADSKSATAAQKAPEPKSTQKAVLAEKKTPKPAPTEAPEKTPNISMEWVKTVETGSADALKKAAKSPENAARSAALVRWAEAVEATAPKTLNEQKVLLSAVRLCEKDLAPANCRLHPSVKIWKENFQNACQEALNSSLKPGAQPLTKDMQSLFWSAQNDLNADNKRLLEQFYEKYRRKMVESVVKAGFDPKMAVSELESLQDLFPPEVKLSQEIRTQLQNLKR